jgi:hypothetical protein
MLWRHWGAQGLEMCRISIMTSKNRGRYDRSKLRYPSDPGLRRGRL